MDQQIIQEDIILEYNMALPIYSKNISYYVPGIVRGSWGSHKDK